MGLIQPISGRPRAKTPRRGRRRRRWPERLFAMASLAPCLLRRRPLRSAAAAALVHPRLALPRRLSLSHTPRGVRSHSLGLVSLEFSGSWMRPRGAGSSPRPPGASPLFEPPRVVSERWMDGRGWWFRFRQPVRHGSTAVTLDTGGGFARFSVGGDAGTKQGAGRKGQPPAKAAKKKMSRKAKVNQLKWYRLKAKKKMKSPNPEVRIRYKLEKVYNISVLLICLVSICCLNVSD